MHSKKDEPEKSGSPKSFREKRIEFRRRILDAIYDRIPVDVVEHLGNANKEIIFAIEGVFNNFVKKIDNRIEITKARRSKTDDGENPDDSNEKE
ncbi:MAG: hypothetical protein M1458_02225 [Deltaproteobacteria bacterium]|nr:hypothetical protein [Deltaproteobacteria bacterium]